MVTVLPPIKLEGEVGPASHQLLERVGGGAGRCHLKVDALRAVEAAVHRQVDPRVDGVRREVQDERRVATAGLASRAAAAGGREGGHEQEDGERDGQEADVVAHRASIGSRRATARGGRAGGGAGEADI